MTMKEVLRYEKEMLTAEDIAPILGKDPQALRIMAREGRLMFPSVCGDHSVRFPKAAFIRFMGYEV